MAREGQYKRDIFRDWLAVVVTSLSGLGVIVLAFTAIWLSADADKSRMAKDVMTMALPLFGTWVGTVLAFYFSRQNFEAASQRVKEITELTLEQKLRSIPVTDAMLALGDITVVRLPKTPEDQIVVSDKLRELEADRLSRLPVLGPKDHPQYIIHRSMLHKFLVDQLNVPGITADKIKKLTLKGLLDTSTELKTLFETSFATVSETATLADAKQAMKETPNCQDVFVTRKGTKGEPVIGWLTNVIIAERARA